MYVSIIDTTHNTCNTSLHTHTHMNHTQSHITHTHSHEPHAVTHHTHTLTCHTLTRHTHSQAILQLSALVDLVSTVVHIAVKAVLRLEEKQHLQNYLGLR